jgi:hypothetical protein
LKEVDRSGGSGCKGASGVPIKELFSCIFFKDAEVSDELFVSKFIQDPPKGEMFPKASKEMGC